jgi:GTP-binding protein
VGKSSLLNAITQKKDLARASNTPGRTRELNFFLIDKSIYLVDMPGYGYAKAPKTEIKQWNRLMKDYLRGRVNLKRVFLLIDSRHGIKENDKEIMELFDECAVTYQVILTKTDKISQMDLEIVEKQVTELIAKKGAAHPVILLTSSEKGLGIEALRKEVLNLA